MPFRLSAKHIFLTYPKCDLTPPQVLDQLRHKLKHDIDWYTIAQEDHKDGTKHIHALIALGKKCNIRNVSFLDLSSPEGQSFHGCYQPAYDVAASHEYVTKDCSNHSCGAVEARTSRIICSRPSSVSTDREKTWADLVNACTSREEFIRGVQANYPRDWVLHNAQIISFANAKFALVDPGYVSPWENDSFIIPKSVSDWMSEYMVM